MAASSSAAGTAFCTKPIASASAAEYSTPVSSISRVRPQPIRPGSSAASITDGMPMCTSGMPNVAPSAAARMSQLAATSRPAPRQNPLMRPITGTGHSRIASQAWCRRVMNRRALSVQKAPSSLRSAPPMKARSPAPVSTTARTVRSPASFSKRGAQLHDQRASKGS